MTQLQIRRPARPVPATTLDRRTPSGRVLPF